MLRFPSLHPRIQLFAIDRCISVHIESSARVKGEHILYNAHDNIVRALQVVSTLWSWCVCKEMAQILAKSTSYLRRYERAAQSHPLSTKCATCFVGFAVGDVVAQSISRSPRVPITTDELVIRPPAVFDGIDPMRTIRMALFGAVIAAPQMHVFFHWLEKV